MDAVTRDRTLVGTDLDLEAVKRPTREEAMRACEGSIAQREKVFIVVVPLANRAPACPERCDGSSGRRLNSP